MPDREALLFANEAFYRAFADRDYPAMEELWSKTAPLACVHPGWGALDDRDEVLASWAAIIGNPDSPDINCLDATAYLYGDTGLVICYEEIEDQYLVASNLFVREGSIWKMVHHQAGPTTVVPTSEEEEPGPSRVN